MGLFLMLYNAKDGVNIMQPILQLTKFKVLDTAGCRNQLHVLDPLRQGKAIQLAHVRNTMVGKEPLNIAVETTALKESVSQ